MSKLNEQSLKQFTSLAKPFIEKFESEIRMDKITEETVLLKRIEEVITEIKQATNDLRHSSKDV